MAGLQKLTVQEAQNAALGQAGCVFVDTNTAVVAPTGKAFVAITFLTDVTLDASGGLIAEDSTRWANTEAAASAGGSGGIQIDASNSFPKGVTIYGRWTEIDLDSAGTLIAYIG
tara:strand:- start:9436 stop:9777 length:342 start_codon:yes stop_codon:yes gene_type:complete